MGTIASNRILPSLKEAKEILLTFTLTTFAWIFFRSNNLSHAAQYIIDLFIGLVHIENYIETYRILYNIGLPLTMLIIIFIVVEWLGRNREFGLEKMTRFKTLNYSVYYAVAFIIFFYSGNKQDFIYFQF